MSTQTGHCLCGKLTYAFDADPAMTAICHCDDCQRQSGAAFSVNVGVPRAALKIDGDTLKTFHTTGTDSGQDRERLFCGECGSPIATILAEMSELAFLKAGTLDDRTWVEPQAEIWTERKHPWHDFDASQRGEFARDMQG